LINSFTTCVFNCVLLAYCNFRGIQPKLSGRRPDFTAVHTESIIDLRTYLRYLRIPIREYSYVFGDNKTVVDGATIPHAKLHKRHNALSFHCVREAMASRFMKMFHLPGKCNPAHIMSKHWGYRQNWSMLQAILFYQGNTIDLVNED
jgi:hypothetical protein